MSGELLVLDDVHKRFRSGVRRWGRGRPVVALDGCSLSVRPGEVLGLLGPNGAGKTTAMRVALGLVRADRGRCTVLGRPVQGELGPMVHDVGAVIEAPRWYPSLTAHQTLALLGRIHAVPTDRVAAVLDEVGLGGDAHRRVGGFSLGMRQRLGLAAALLRRPRLLVLDEPANGLDPSGVHRLRTLLRSIVDDGGAVLLSSHVLAEVEQLADRVVMVTRGRAVADGPLDELLACAGRWRVGVAEAVDLRPVVGPGFVLDPDAAGAVVTATSPESDVRRLSAALTAAGLTITELTPVRARLEDRYLELVGGAAGTDVEGTTGSARTEGWGR